MLDWFQTAAIGFAILFCLCDAWAYWLNYSHGKGTDFLSFWAAGRLTLIGYPELAYNVGQHRAFELSVAYLGGLLPFPYPPPFLFVLAPLASLNYWVAFPVWIIVTGSFFAWRAARLAPLPYALANPIAMVNGWIGQNGFLTAGIFMWGTSLLRERPLLAGAVLGLLVVKPQLALLLPVALLAGREWRAIAGGALCASALLLISLPVFGLATFQAFLSSLPLYAGFLSHSRLPWNELASVFAAARLVGIAQPAALAIQIVAALVAAIVTWWAWSTKLPERVPILAAASVLVSPYLFTYDALILMVPFAWFVQSRRDPLLIVFLWLCLLLPIVSYSGHYRGPNTIPLAAIVCLSVLCRGAIRVASAPDHDDQIIPA